MLESLHISATGMHTQQTYVDVISNNLANINTMGFKKSRVDFADLMYRQAATINGNLDLSAEQKPLGVGSSVSNVAKVFSAGEVKRTERELDVAIDGNGFFEIVMPDGSYGYTRTGALQLNNEGVLATADNLLVSPLVQVPADAESLVIKSDGAVMAKVVDRQQLIKIGEIELAQFVNPSGLKPIGNNLYTPTHESGNVFYAGAGEDGAGALRQGYLEASNVELVEELTGLILAQRAYEINSKVVQASDDMLGIINNLRR